MNIHNLLKEFENVTPPFQAAILNQKDILTSNEDWNRTTPKGKALFCQFDAVGEENREFEFVPDGCFHFLFKCDPDNPSSIVLGIGTSSCGVELEENKTYFYVTPYSMLGTNCAVSASELLGSTVLMKDVFDDADRITEDISKAAWVAKSSLPPFLLNTYPSIVEVFREAKV